MLKTSSSVLALRSMCQFAVWMDTLMPIDAWPNVVMWILLAKMSVLVADAWTKIESSFSTLCKLCKCKPHHQLVFVPRFMHPCVEPMESPTTISVMQIANRAWLWIASKHVLAVPVAKTTSLIPEIPSTTHERIQLAHAPRSIARCVAQMVIHTETNAWQNAKPMCELYVMASVLANRTTAFKPMVILRWIPTP